MMMFNTLLIVWKNIIIKFYVKLFNIYTKRFRNMNDKFLKIITYLTIGIISYISESYFYKMIEKNHIEVPGTVIGK